MDKPEDQNPPAQPRRPYQPPRVEESATFEHLVLACTHVTFLECAGKAKPTGTTRS